jgi:peptide/nickel transport system substrate-binding protein
MITAFLVNYRYGPQYPQWYFEFSSDGLAKSWEISADGFTYTFHLREGVKWQNKPPLNGRELVANDVKWSIQNIIDTPGSPRGQPLSAIDKMDTPDKYTLIIHLKEPRASLLHILANPYVEILAPELKETPGLWDTSKSWVGAGPFMLKEYVPNTRMVFEKNPTYYRANEGLPYLDVVHRTLIPDLSTSLAAFRAEQIDIRGISRIDLDSVKGTNPNIYCEENQISATQPAICMRNDKPPFNDARVRQAVSMAINRQEVINTQYYGYGIEQHGPINAASPWYLKDQGECDKYWKYNPTEAKRLLAEAGYPNGFETTLNTTGAWGATWMEYAELIVDYLSKVGIKANIKTSDLGAHYVNRLAKYEGLCWTYTWGGATVEPDNFLPVMFLPGGYVQYSAVDDPELSRLIIAQQTALTPEKRQEYLNEIQRRFACQQYQIQWPEAYGVTCQQPWVRNYRMHAADMSAGRYVEITWLTEQAPGRKK